MKKNSILKTLFFSLLIGVGAFIALVYGFNCSWGGCSNFEKNIAIALLIVAVLLAIICGFFLLSLLFKIVKGSENQ